MRGQPPGWGGRGVARELSAASGEDRAGRDPGPVPPQSGKRPSRISHSFLLGSRGADELGMQALEPRSTLRPRLHVANTLRRSLLREVANVGRHEAASLALERNSGRAGTRRNQCGRSDAGGVRSGG